MRKPRIIYKLLKRYASRVYYQKMLYLPMLKQSFVRIS
jgi:hypothetical protein